MSLHIVLPPFVFEIVRGTGFHVSISCLFLFSSFVLSDGDVAELKVRAKKRVESLPLLNGVRNITSLRALFNWKSQLSDYVISRGSKPLQIGHQHPMIFRVCTT